MFWEAAPSEQYPEGYTTRTLLPPTHEDPVHHVQMMFRVPLPLPARVTVRALMRPIGLDVVDELIASGHLDPSIRAAMPTYELRGTKTESRLENGLNGVSGPQGKASCDYRCEFEPNDPSCR